MIEITITTKTGKFVMRGEEFVERYYHFCETHPIDYKPEMTTLARFLSSYEEEVSG